MYSVDLPYIIAFVCRYVLEFSLSLLEFIPRISIMHTSSLTSFIH